jgi:hypothetical protein
MMVMMRQMDMGDCQEWINEVGRGKEKRVKRIKVCYTHTYENR